MDERRDLSEAEDHSIELQWALANDPDEHVRFNFLKWSGRRDRDVIRHMEANERDPFLREALREQCEASPAFKRLLPIDHINDPRWLDVLIADLGLSEAIRVAIWKKRPTFEATQSTVGEEIDRLLATGLS